MLCEDFEFLLSKLEIGRFKDNFRKLRYNSDKHFVSWDLRGKNLTQKEVECLAEALRTNTTLKGLDISGNDINDKGAKLMSSALMKNKALERLEVRNANIGFEGTKSIAESLTINTTLIALDVGYNNIGTEGIKFLCTSLAINSSLRILSIDANNAGLDAMVALFKILNGLNKTLNILSVRHNNINSNGAYRIAKGLENNKSIKILDISNNQIGTQGAIELSNTLRTNDVLMRLILKDNKINYQGMFFLRKALKYNDTVTSLDLSSNVEDDPRLKHKDPRVDIEKLLKRNRQNPIKLELKLKEEGFCDTVSNLVSQYIYPWQPDAKERSEIKQVIESKETKPSSKLSDSKAKIFKKISKECFIS